MDRAFSQVDVFTEKPFMGNPVAVIHDAMGLSDGQMQAIARWTNLSETTFVLPPNHPDADYRLRIFTPSSEIPFAGHPTLGSAWARLQSGLHPKKEGILVQECAKGLVVLKFGEESVFLKLPEPGYSEAEEHELRFAAQALGIDRSEILAGAHVDVGPIWFTLQLASARKVVELKPDMAKIASSEGITGITVFGPHPDGNIEVRSFAPAFGVPEDPVCGSGNGCVAALIRRKSLISGSGYTALQGRCLGRDGKVEIQYDDAIWVGGRCAVRIAGRIRSE
jgi:PhzF family phenazine biosynthesis protein